MLEMGSIRLALVALFSYIFALYTFVTLFESCIYFFLRFSLSTSITYTWVVSLCICIVYVRNAFQRIPDIFFFQHTDLVYICYILWDVFPIYLHCIRSLHFLRAVSNSFLDSARLRPLHILGWFPYVFALYMFVTLFRGFLIFFFSTYRSCIHLLHLMGCFPYVFALYTFVTLFESCI